MLKYFDFVSNSQYITTEMDFTHVTEGENYLSHKTTIEFDEKQTANFLYSTAFAVKVFLKIKGEVLSDRKICFEQFVDVNEICKVLSRGEFTCF